MNDLNILWKERKPIGELLGGFGNWIAIVVLME